MANLYQINNVEDNVVFLCWKVFKSDNSSTVSETRNSQVIFVEKIRMKVIKIISFRKQNLRYLFHAWWEKAFQGTVDNLTLHFFTWKAWCVAPV